MRQETILCIVLASAALAVVLGTAHRALGASLSATVAQDGAVISNAEGSASVPRGGRARVAIALVLEPGEEASAFEASFDLIARDVDLERQLAVDCGAAAGGGWQNMECSYASAAEDPANIAVSLTSANAGGERVVLALDLVGQESPGTLEVALRDRLVFFDAPEAPHGGVLRVDQIPGRVIARVQLPEPARLWMQVAALGVLLLLRRYASARGAARAGAQPPRSRPVADVRLRARTRSDALRGRTR